jgi:phosphoribosylanthranilate isomerase
MYEDKLKPRVKICCISSVEEAYIAMMYGADAIGLVGPMPSGPGVIDDVLIRKIAAITPPPIATFLLTSETKAEDVISHYNRVHTSTIQLVDRIDNDDYALIKHSLPHVRLVQVIHVIDEDSIAEALEVLRYVDAILLDSGNPHKAVKELGGTGRIHNWNLSRQIVKAVNVPVFLAGGINAENVREAVDTVYPFGIDLCSGVRTDGNLDPKKLSLFFEAINS